MGNGKGKWKGDKGQKGRIITREVTGENERERKEGEQGEEEVKETAEKGEEGKVIEG